MAGTGNGGKTPKRPTVQNGKTRPFSPVKRNDTHLAKERQRRQYEQQKKEKIVFALFVVVIIVLILVAILVFKKAIDNGEANDTQDHIETTLPAGDTSPSLGESGHFLTQMCKKSQIYEGNLVLVDSSHPFTAQAPELANIYSGRNKHPKGEKTAYAYNPAFTNLDVSTETLAALNQMADTFYTLTGLSYLNVAKAYDASSQNDHATGLSFDLSVYDTDKTFVLDDKAVYSDYEWIFQNAHKYGFIMVAPQTSGERHYHFRYVGIPAATYMFKTELSLSEFLMTIRTDHALADGEVDVAKVTIDNGETYEIYYVAATGGDMVNVPVPENALHVNISGDNENGFIVTARMS